MQDIAAATSLMSDSIRWYSIFISDTCSNASEELIRELGSNFAADSMKNK